MIKYSKKNVGFNASFTLRLRRFNTNLVERFSEHDSKCGASCKNTEPLEGLITVQSLTERRTMLADFSVRDAIEGFNNRSQEGSR